MTTSEPEEKPDLQNPAAVRTRAGILCYRKVQCEGKDACEFLLVSRQSCVGEARLDKYTIPAGKFEPEKDVSYEACATREALEEAGVECDQLEDLGWHDSTSKKSNELVRTQYFLGHFVRALDFWQEDSTRERCWFEPSEALQKVSYRPDLSDVVRQGLNVLTRPPSPPTMRSSDCLSFEPLLGRGGYNRAPLPTLAEEPPMATPKDNKLLQSPLETEDTRERYMGYSHQVGGHYCMVKPVPGSRLEVELPLQVLRQQYSGLAIDADVKTARSGDNCIVNGNRVVLKPLDSTEERVYRHLLHGSLASLRHFMPLFYGTKKLRPEQIENLTNDLLATSPNDKVLDSQQDELNNKVNADSQNVRRYIVLEDLGNGASKPCFLDLKVGCRQRSARHNLQKRAHMAKKAAQSTSATLGFRICGMRCYNPETKGIKHYDKYWGQRVSVETMTESLTLFFPNDPNHRNGPMVGIWRNLLDLVIEKLGQLESTLQQLRGLRFWGSSLLVGFDAALAEEERREDFLKSVRLNIIDFANFEDVGGDKPDEEYLCGLQNLQVFLKGVLEGSPSDWIPGDLTPPPPAEAQDEEQDRVWRALQAKSPSHHALVDMEQEANFMANARTISGAVGRPLLRELASHHIVLPRSEQPESEGKARKLNDLFS